MGHNVIGGYRWIFPKCQLNVSKRILDGDVCEQMEDILSSFCGPDAAGWFELPEKLVGDGSFLLTLLPGTLHDREAARQATGNLG